MTGDVVTVSVLQAFGIALVFASLSIGVPLIGIWICERWLGSVGQTDRWLELPESRRMRGGRDDRA